jgi:ribosomal protein S18 acetylase RimI-like enzyme
MLRPVRPDETDALVAMAEATGFFKPLEIDALCEVFDDYHEGIGEEDHVASVWDDPSRGVEGFVYYAPTPMTDRTWHLYWIVVKRESQGRGIGRQMLQLVEDDIRRRLGRLLVVETSSTPHYEPTRQFYRRCGYSETATVPDFYAEGDGMVVFTKPIGPVMA